MPASLGYIQGIFQEENLPRLPRRSVPAPRTVTADRRKLDLGERTFHTEFAELFLFAFDLARMGLDNILKQVGMSQTHMIQADCAVRSLLALKLFGIGHPSQVMAESLDQGLALFAGLNAIPKRTVLTEYPMRSSPLLRGHLCIDGIMLPPS